MTYTPFIILYISGYVTSRLVVNFLEDCRNFSQNVGVISPQTGFAVPDPMYGGSSFVAYGLIFLFLSAFLIFFLNSEVILRDAEERGRRYCDEWRYWDLKMMSLDCRKEDVTGTETTSKKSNGDTNSGPGSTASNGDFQTDLNIPAYNNTGGMNFPSPGGFDNFGGSGGCHFGFVDLPNFDFFNLLSKFIHNFDFLNLYYLIRFSVLSNPLCVEFFYLFILINFLVLLIFLNSLFFEKSKILNSSEFNKFKLKYMRDFYYIWMGANFFVFCLLIAQFVFFSAVFAGGDIEFVFPQGISEDLRMYIFNNIWELRNSKFLVYFSFSRLFLFFIYLLFLNLAHNILCKKFNVFFDEFKVYSCEFLLLTGFFILGSLVLLNSFNFLAVFLSLELQSFCVYILASSKKGSLLSSEAGLKYFIFGSFCSLLGILGISLFYYETGFLNFFDLSLYFSTGCATDFAYLGVFLFLFNFFFKLGLFPLNFWMPDVFKGSPFIYMIFFSGVSKIAPFFYFLFFCAFFLENFLSFSYVLFFCSLVSILIGTLLAFVQRSIKKLIAYSSMANMGFCFLVLSNGFGDFSSIAYCMGYFIIYILILMGFFSVLSCVQLFSDNESFFIDDFKDLVKIRSVFFFGVNLCWFFLVFLFSFAGIPPFLGFFPKMYVLFSLIQNNLFFGEVFVSPFILLLLLLVFFIILMAFYYLYLVKFSAFLRDFDKPNINNLFSKNINNSNVLGPTVSIRSRHNTYLIIFQIIFLVILNLFGFIFSFMFFDFLDLLVIFSF